MKRIEMAMSRSVDDEVVILDVKSGRYFGLNDVGALIWGRLEHDCSHDDLIDEVVSAYDIERDEASADVENLLNQLIDAGLVIE